MKCSDMERGCEWEGTVGTLEKHVAKQGGTTRSRVVRFC